MGKSTAELSATHLRGLWGALRPLDAERDSARIYAQTHGAEIGPTWQEMKVGPFQSEADFAAHVAELVADPQRVFFAGRRAR